MPVPRNLPARSSQRRNSQQDDSASRARTGRAAKPATAKPERTDVAPQSPSPNKLSPNVTRKTTRSASNNSGQSFETAPEVYASYEEPLLMVFGLSREFFERLKKHHGKLPKERKVLVTALTQQEPTTEEESESEDNTDDESEDDAQTVSHATPRGRGRARGGRGSRGGRGGRGRGGRSRGRGGRARGGITKMTASARTKPSRNAALMLALAEEDHDFSSTNQTSVSENAKPSPRPNADESMIDSSEEEDADEDIDTEEEDESTDDAQIRSTTPAGSPPAGLHESILNGTYTPAAVELEPGPVPTTAKSRATPKISFSKSVPQTPREPASTSVQVVKMLDPEDDELSDSDLPEPWVEGASRPTQAECDDMADYLLRTKFEPMTDVQEIIASLTKYPFAQRSTESLHALAENTQMILKAWQDQYLELDAKTAPLLNPAKKACHGGRIPVDPQIFEDIKEADLYGYTYDARKAPGRQDPWAQRPGAEKNAGRELRTRRNRDMLDSGAPSEEEEEEENEGRSTKRQRKAPHRFDGTDQGTGSTTPKKHNGWGGARKKGVSRFAKLVSETPEPEGRTIKRGKAVAASLLQKRIQEMREESAVTSSGEEGSSVVDADDFSDVNPKRGRPAGSKNVNRRSDFGVKKGPRKKNNETTTPISAAHGPNPPPPALQSQSQGQGQFSLDAQTLSDTQPLLASNSAETVFQATPHPAAAHDESVVRPPTFSIPDSYMITAPLSEYTNNYVEDYASPSGSRRKPKVKSEKRSHSMTVWWAERKARKQEEDRKNGVVPTKAPPSRPTSSSGKKTNKAQAVAPAPASEYPPPEAQHTSAAQVQHPPPHPHQPHHPQEMYVMTPGQHPHFMYVSAPPAHSMMMQYSPLAPLSSNSYPGPRTLAPAPMPLQHMPTYPSPYGPHASRPRSSGHPPALAPAPQQYMGPYANVHMGREVMQGHAEEERRESR